MLKEDVMQNTRETEHRSCLHCLKRRFSLLNALNSEQISHIDRHRTMVRFKAGEYIFKEGTRPFGLLCLSEGKVKVSVTGNTGHELIIALLKPSDFIGFADLIAGKAHTTSARTLVDSIVCVVVKEDFFKVARANTELLRKICLSFGENLGSTHDRMVSLTQKHMRARLADALLFVRAVYGESEDDHSLNAPLKRSDIAALSNMTTANAIRTLSEFIQDGLVSVEKRRITLVARQELQAISL